MVYGGKPSKGCYACRKRRTKCDQAPGHCGNCRRVGRVCPGYRSELDLNFVDETERLVKKHAPHNVVAFSVTRVLTPTIDDYALSCFYSIHTVYPGPHSNTRCSYVADDALLAVMKALGCAAQGTMVRHESLLHHAYGFYGTAIKLTNATLCSAAARSDATLLTVIALTYFEAITGKERNVSDAWSNHVRGTSSLIALRGSEQIETSDGRILFSQATTNLIALHARSQARIPPHIRELAVSLSAIPQAKNDVVWRVSQTWMDLVDFYSDVMQHRFNDADTIIRDARRLDTRFCDMLKEPAPEWQYWKATIPPHMRNELEPIPYTLVYRSPLAAQIWTTLRHGRLILHIILRRCLQRRLERGDATAGESVKAQLNSAEATITQLQFDILASAPQFVGLTESVRGFLADKWRLSTNETPGLGRYNRRATLSELSNESSPRLNVPDAMADVDDPYEMSASIGISEVVPLQSKNLPVLRTSRADNLVWALALVAECTTNDDPKHKASIRFLRLLGQHLGMMMAIVQADRLERFRA